MVTVIKISINKQIDAARACELCEDDTHHMTILSNSQEELIKSMHNEINSTCHDLGKMMTQEPSETLHLNGSNHERLQFHSNGSTMVHD